MAKRYLGNFIGEKIMTIKESAIRVKSLNALIVKHLQSVVFIYKVKNMIFIRKLKNIMKNTLNNTFVIYVVFEKKDVNILQKYIVFNIKRLVYKNHI